MASFGITVVIAAVAIVVGVLVWSNIYATVGADRIIDESLGNQTVAGGGLAEFTVAQPPVYIGAAVDGTILNSTLSLTANNGTSISYVDVGGTLILNGSYNVTGAGLVTISAEDPGEVFMTYTNVELSAGALATGANIDDLTYNAYSLAAVGIIVLAAVAILSLLFVFGRRV